MAAELRRREPTTTRRRLGLLGSAVLMLAGLGVAPVAAASGASAATEPVVSAPRQNFPPPGTTVPQKSSNVVYEVTSWQLQDPGTNGFSNFLLEQFNTYTNTWSVAYFGTGTTYEALLPTIQFTEFRLTAYDGAGNPGPTKYGQGFVPFIADDSDASAGYLTSISYSTGWRRIFASTAYGGSYLRSSRDGASFTYCGYFTRIALVAPRTTSGGKATATVFGSTSTVNFHSATYRYREVVRRWNTEAQHGVTAGGGPTYCLTVTANSSAPIYVDAVEYNVPDIIE
jgi:hypothetical protein